MTDGRAISVSDIKPIGNHILVRKCETAKPDLIEVPDQYREQCEFVEILAVGPKCKVFGQDHVGKVVQCPEMADGMHSIGDSSSEFWICKETVFDPIVFDL